MVKKTTIFVMLLTAITIMLLFPNKLEQDAQYIDCKTYYINELRCQFNADPIKLKQELIESALSKAQMLDSGEVKWNKSAHDGFFEHIKKFDKNVTWAGEDLAQDFYSDKDVYDAWMESASHRAVMLHTSAKYFGYACVNSFCVLHMSKD